MTQRSVDDINSGIEAATAEEPFLLSKAEVIAHIEAHDRTGCGGYSTITHHDGERVVAWDYACRD